MPNFKKTLRQTKAVKILTKIAKHIMLYGGSRSGKTFILVRSVIIRACKVKSRHVMLRRTFNSIKTSIWMDTLPKVMELCFPNLSYEENKTDYFITLPNGSEIWIGGLDDKKRTEKILGKEYSTIYFNECSEFDYQPIQIALTRLAEKNSLSKKAYYDCNPPSKKHWSYWLFEKKINPVESEPIKDPQNYESFLMNPKDNLDNIDGDYIALLEALPEKERQRFLDGLFVDADDGLAYYSFDQEKHVKETVLQAGTLFVGMDFNVNPMTATIFQFIDNMFLFHDEVWLNNSDTYKMSNELIRRGYYGNVIPDSTGKNRKTSGKSDFEILKDAGFNVMSTRNPFITDRVNNTNRLFQENRIIINPKCKKLINDFNKVSWKDNKLFEGEDKMLTHISDSATYGLWKLEPIGQFKGSTVTIGRTN